MKNSIIRAAASIGILAMLGALPVQAAPEVPGAPQNGPIALVGATIHPVSGPAIEGGVILIVDGKIAGIGPVVDVPEGATRIDAAGKHVYPGLIDACSQLGLVEIGSVRATRDAAETGQINPNVKAQVAVNPDSELIPVTRANGILTSLVVPSGGVIAGTGACMALDGWTWEDMTLCGGVAMYINWPRMAPIEAWWLEESAREQSETRDRDLKVLQTAFDDARAYQKAKAAHAADSGSPAPAFDIRWEAMAPVLEGQLPLLVEADEIRQIQSAVAFARREGAKLIICGGYDAPQCASLLKEYDVPVVVGGVYRLPMRRSDDYDAAYRIPAQLHEAGIRYCIANPSGGSSGNSAPNARNLPYHAGTAAAYGLPADDALKAITLYPAQILGVADKLGTLEAGKDATLIVTTGDPLEISTEISAAYIQGREVQLSDKQRRLWEKYKEKYRRMGIQN